MPIIQANFKDVSDKMLPIPGGIKKFVILKCPIEPTKAAKAGEDPGATNLVVTHELTGEADDKLNGREITRYLSTKMLTEIKRLALSCGIPRDVVEGPNGLDTDLLVGKTCMAEVKNTVTTDAQTGIQKEYSNIISYLIPGDVGYPG